MYISMKVWDNDNNDGGRLELYKRGSLTCTGYIGTIEFDDKSKKKILLDMLMNGHPEVAIMENHIPTGNFVDNYFKK